MLWFLLTNDLDQCLEISMVVTIQNTVKYFLPWKNYWRFSIFEYEEQCMLRTLVLLFWVTQKCLALTLFQCRHKNEIKLY